MEILNIFQALDVDQSSKFTAAPGRSRPWHSIDHRFINISLSCRRLPCWVIDTPSAVDKMKQNGKGLIKLPVHIYSIIYIMHHNATYSVALRKVDAILFVHSTGRRFPPTLRAHGITTWVSFSWTWQKSGTSDILSKGESFHITHTKTKTQCRCICRHLSWTFILNNSKFRLLSRIWMACKGCSNLTLQGRWKVQIGKFCQDFPTWHFLRGSIGLAWVQSLQGVSWSSWSYCIAL